MANGLSAALGANSHLPHRCREGGDLSFTEGQESPRHVFPQDLSLLSGPNFLGVVVLQVIRDAIFWDVRRDFLRLLQRADPLVIVELLRRQVIPFLLEHQLCI